MTFLLHELWAIPAALGFAMFFNVRRRALVPIAVIAFLAHAIDYFIRDAGGNAVSGAFVGAFFIGCVAYTLGPWTKEAAPVYAFAPVIPLIPGAYMLDAMKSLTAWLTKGADDSAAAEILTQATSSALTAAAITLALAIGTISPMLLLPRARTAED